MIQYISAQSYLCTHFYDSNRRRCLVCRISSLPKSVFWSTQAKAMQNKAAKSALKTDIKKFEAAVAEGNRSEADVAYKVAVKAVDKAAAKGLLHKNNAANKKSSMTIKLNKLA